MIDGVKINLGGTEYVVPPLSLKQAKKYEPALKEFRTSGGGLDEKGLDTVVDVIHAAISRNYPEVKRENLEETLDLGNWSTAWYAVLGISGFAAREGGEGEAAPGSPSTGTGSTPN